MVISMELDNTTWGVQSLAIHTLSPISYLLSVLCRHHWHGRTNIQMWNANILCQLFKLVVWKKRNLRSWGSLSLIFSSLAYWPVFLVSRRKRAIYVYSTAFTAQSWYIVQRLSYCCKPLQQKKWKSLFLKHAAASLEGAGFHGYLLKTIGKRYFPPTWKLSHSGITRQRAQT